MCGEAREKEGCEEGGVEGGAVEAAAPPEKRQTESGNDCNGGEDSIFALDAHALAGELFRMGVAGVGVEWGLGARGGGREAVAGAEEGGWGAGAGGGGKAGGGRWAHAVDLLQKYGAWGRGREGLGAQGVEAKGAGVRVWVRCKRRGSRFGSGVGQAVKNLLAAECERQLGWVPTGDRSCAALELHLVLYDGGCLAEVPLFVGARASINGGIPQPGLKPAECWALAKSLDIRRGHLILDAMCGSGSVLLEAALFWPHARYVGLDREPTQVERAQANAQRVRSAVTDFRQADVSEPGGIPLAAGACDGIICDLPFGKQYGSVEGNQLLYPRVLAELARVLTRLPHGVMVLLTDSANLALLCQSIRDVTDAASLPDSSSPSNDRWGGDGGKETLDPGEAGGEKCLQIQCVRGFQLSPATTGEGAIARERGSATLNS